jgi:hypothetical protein
MMTMFDLIDDGAQFTAHSLMESHAEEFRDPVGSQSPKPDLAAALENFTIIPQGGKMASGMLN